MDDALAERFGRLCKQLRDALRADQVDEAARLIEQLRAQPQADALLESWWPWQEIYGDLADSYSYHRRYQEAITAKYRAIEAGLEQEPDGRADIAEWLLCSGRRAQADALFAEVKRDTPEDPWLYHNAGNAYAELGDSETALAWFSEGLEVILGMPDSDDVYLKGAVEDLVEWRCVSLRALGRSPRDALTRRAAMGGQNREDATTIGRPLSGHTPPARYRQRTIPGRQPTPCDLDARSGMS